MKMSAALLVAITLINASFAAVSISQAQPAMARAADTVDVLRGRKLEIVDDQGRVRASITVHPGKPSEEEATVLRLINNDGKPGVKLASSHTAAGMSLVAEQGNYLQVFSDGVKLTRDHKARASWP